jgi:hypothetical protein
MAGKGLTLTGTLLSQAQTGRQAGRSAATQAIEQGAYAITQTQYPEKIKELGQQFALTKAQAVDASAASGTLGSTKEKRTLSTLKSKYGWNLADTYRQQKLAQLGQQQEQISYATKQTGFATGIQQLGLTGAKTGFGITETETRLHFAMKELGLGTTQKIQTAITKSAKAASTGAAAQGTQTTLLSLMTGVTRQGTG